MMKCNEINLRDPFILHEDGLYYMYGTRGQGYGIQTGGFDVYTSTDLENWSEPTPCFDSEKYDLNTWANWAPEVHKYKNSYYMLATFTRAHNNLRATFILKADNPKGPFVPHGNGPLTPEDWECLDGTLYIDKKGQPYLVFCHEHTQIIDGTICYVPLNDDLSKAVGEPILLFAASSFLQLKDAYTPGKHCVTDGPFFYRSSEDDLFMIWSTGIKGNYVQCLVKFNGGEIGNDFTHLPVIFEENGGHGMIFSFEGQPYLTLHSPNTKTLERPAFFPIAIYPDHITILS